jgi:hypothetical protein
MIILVYFSRFGMLYQEKSGSPDSATKIGPIFAIRVNDALFSQQQCTLRHKQCNGLHCNALQWINN